MPSIKALLVYPMIYCQYSIEIIDSRWTNESVRFQISSDVSQWFFRIQWSVEVVSPDHIKTRTERWPYSRWHLNDFSLKENCCRWFKFHWSVLSSSVSDNGWASNMRRATMSHLNQEWISALTCQWVQERRKSTANALDLLQSCNKPSKY